MIGDNSRKTIYISSLVVLVIVIAVSVVLVCTGDTSPREKQRPTVVFDHDSHTSYASECLDCHHRYEDGDTSENVLDEGDLEENFPEEAVMLNAVSDGEIRAVQCGYCHNDKAGTNAQEAFHNQCIGCHEADGGPLMCGECHINSGTASDSE